MVEAIGVVNPPVRRPAAWLEACGKAIGAG
jgi:hypothetical protein